MNILINPNKQEQDFKATSKTALILQGEEDALFLQKWPQFFISLVVSKPLRYLSLVNCNLSTETLYDIAHSLTQTN